MNTSSNFGGPIVSAISSEATLWYVTISESDQYRVFLQVKKTNV